MRAKSLFMKRILLGSCLLFAACAPKLNYTRGEVRFPSISAADLNGLEVTLPAELPAERTLLLIAFKREQQPDIDTWIAALKGTSIPWLELPVVPNFGSVFRAIVDNGMRTGIKTVEARARVITLFTEPAAFRDALGIGQPESIYAAVVTRDGAVLKVIPGRFSPESLEELKQAL